MNYTLKTEMDVNTVLILVKKYVAFNSVYFNVPQKLSSYLEETYQLSVQQILQALKKSIRVTRSKDDLIHVTLFDSMINNVSLKEVLQLMEYGNREIPPFKLISAFFNNVLTRVQNVLGGV